MRRPGYQFLILLAAIVVLAGCGTVVNDNPGEFKSRGVFTTVATEGHDADTAPADFVSCTNFTVSQIPEAVVTGYGNPDGTAQPFELQLVESPYETIVFTNRGEAFAGKAALIDLPVSESGRYQVRLLMNDAVRDAWTFTVVRDATSPRAVIAPAAATSEPEVKSEFEVVVAPWAGGDIFSDYDAALVATLTAAIKNAVQTNREVFAQALPGHVAIRFDMDQKGEVSAPEIISTTLNDAQGQFFLNLLTGGSPYRPWSTVVKTVYGDHPRTMKVTFYVD
jgi:hypothetical protein